MRHQSDLSLAVFALFASGGLFALLVSTVLPPERPIAWYLPPVVTGIATIVSVTVLIIGKRLTVFYAAWVSCVYLVMLVMLVMRASNLARVTVTSMLVVVVIVLFAWFMPVWLSRLVGYVTLALIGGIIVIRFPTNDGVLTAVSLVLLSALLTEVFGRFRRNLQRSSLIDHLGGTWNRAGFEVLLDAELRVMKRTSAPLSVVYLDLDDFKSINDARGHHGGDEVLRQVSASLMAGVRARDSVARVGGDEFVLLLPGANAADARALAERLRDAVTACPWSYGVAEYRLGETTIEFIERSDAEMMRVKRSRGRRG